MVIFKIIISKSRNQSVQFVFENNFKGKRSYLFDLIQNKDDQAGLYEQPRLDAYNVADKLSFRKSFNKFGRRSDNELLKDAFIDFLRNIDEAELLALMSQKSSHEGADK